MAILINPITSPLHNKIRNKAHLIFISFSVTIKNFN
jgi:hypothetical protein